MTPRKNIKKQEKINILSEKETASKDNVITSKLNDVKKKTLKEQEKIKIL